jgi:hypothetical protein
VIRAALYWAPEGDDPLWAAGNAWLGRDPELNVPVSQPDVPGIGEVTAAARVYGFHATLRPPMRLAGSWVDFMEAAEAAAGAVAPFDLPALAVADLDGFLALREATPCPALQALADACVAWTEPCRLPADAVELARRRAAGLSAEQEAMLRRWGYPYVMQCWRFHMTLTRRLSPEAMRRMREAAEAHFSSTLNMRRRVSAISVFTQRAGDPFRLSHRLELRGQARSPAG